MHPGQLRGWTRVTAFVVGVLIGVLAGAAWLSLPAGSSNEAAATPPTLETADLADAGPAGQPRPSGTAASGTVRASGDPTVGLGGTPDQLTRPADQPYRAFTLAATGDLLIHSPVRNRAAVADGFDFGPQLAAARADVSAADLGLCHLEVPLDPDGPYSSYPIFNAPAELARAIAETGWDVCSTASNHSADKGMEGVVATLDALDAAGVEHRGMARSFFEALQIRLTEVNDVDVGLLSATYGLNGLPVPGGNAWSVQLIEPERLLDQARRLRLGGADVVVLSLHWGAEYQHTPTEEQRAIATQLLTDGAIDAIIGHHAHVIQPVEWIEGRPVVYGLGNFLSAQQQAVRRDGAIVNLAFQEGPDGWVVEEVHARPTYVDGTWTVNLAEPGGALADSAERTLGHLGVPLSPPVP
ncbi:CapA family protein [Euzebya tangerina]|uniref:CapA family protein n=1 Tax=Euzebya tangerina TaxID=591198 RepID=UPI000E3247ED|nr:CapA family protein [Euzebya tangerina]